MKKMIATLAFIGILAVNNAFAGLLVSDFAQTEPETTQCTTKARGLDWGILMSDLAGNIGIGFAGSVPITLAGNIGVTFANTDNENNTCR